MLEFKDIINESGLELTDISSEEYRIYYPKASVTSVVIALIISLLPEDKASMIFELSGVKVILNPIALHVSDSGGHRIIDAKEKCYYIKPDSWGTLKWKSKDGEPHFVK